MNFSKFAQRFSEHSGIILLMDDLGEAMAGEQNVLMLGGGNPAHIPEVQAFFRDRMQQILDRPGEFARVVGDYDPPRGSMKFLEALADLLNHEYGWGLTAENVALTTGSQAAFFLMFNMFAGEFAGGATRKILLPMAPEYIGYADVGLADGIFTANRPTIEKLPDRTFKYHVDFDRLTVDESTGAICVSRPTNPTGNVLTDSEVSKLVEISGAREIPLIIDNAYGMPFPSIIFTEAELVWNENIILSMSLSKLGLPATRTGIVVARSDIITALSNINGILTLAPESVGPALACDLVQSGKVTEISRTLIRPYYEEKAQRAIALLHEELAGVDYYIHKAEGAIFLWLWFPGLPVTSQELYQRLKQRGVLVIPGHYFFPGLDDDPWPHKQECIRMTYSMNDDVVREGIKIIAEEVKAL
ncbi:MAG: valine--pyruvate transaminase [Gammaproteobacteria bacterium]|nr:valine--pyruvate transaminase [Gammaproteobacteria bacterium]